MWNIWETDLRILCSCYLHHGTIEQFGWFSCVSMYSCTINWVFVWTRNCKYPFLFKTGLLSNNWFYYDTGHEVHICLLCASASTIPLSKGLGWIVMTTWPIISLYPLGGLSRFMGFQTDVTKQLGWFNLLVLVKSLMQTSVWHLASNLCSISPPKQPNHILNFNVSSQTYKNVQNCLFSIS